jgi:predicted ATP-grasp superfamily ATP-dependent carboligase
MAHLLIVDLPGGNDTDIVQAAVARGDTFTFLTSDYSLYAQQPEVLDWVKLAAQLIEVPGFAYAEVASKVLHRHHQCPIDAVLCLLDIRLIDSAKLASELKLPHLNVSSAHLLRDKYAVRQRLAERGVSQKAYQLATNNQELIQAVELLGLPVLIKPVDGYGSQNIVVLQDPEDLMPWMTPLNDMLPSHADYGLGVKANDRLVVERFMKGQIVGCDTVTINGQHQLLGVNEKLFFEPPSFAIEGGCFIPNEGQFSVLEAYVQSLLDAVDFDWGYAHIEIMLTPEGPFVIEINPRLVGAKIARLVSMALGVSVHQHLIELHLGHETFLTPEKAGQIAVSRWVVSEHIGILDQVILPDTNDSRIRMVDILKKKGDSVRPPFENADRIGYVMTCAASQKEAEWVAKNFIAHCHCVLT